MSRSDELDRELLEMTATADAAGGYYSLAIDALGCLRESESRVEELATIIRRIAVQHWQTIDVYDDEVVIGWSQCNLCKARVEGDEGVVEHLSTCILHEAP